MNRKRWDWEAIMEALVYASVFAIIIWLWLYYAPHIRGAPAPWPKHRPNRIKAIPERCVMHWCGTRYETRFTPNGVYRAGTAYAGTWWMQRIDGRDVIHIRERVTGSLSDHETYRIWLAPCWREGSIGQPEGGSAFRLTSASASASAK